MKKGFLTVVVALLCAMVCAFGLVACNNNETPNENGNNGTQTVAVESVTLNKTQLTLEVGGEETLTATVAPDGATNKTVTWSVSPAGVITVDGGKVTAVAAGSATVTATAGGKSATCNVTVSEPIVYTVTENEWKAAIEGLTCPDNVTITLYAKDSGSAEERIYGALKFDRSHNAVADGYDGDIEYKVYEDDGAYRYEMSDGEWIRIKLSGYDSVDELFESGVELNDFADKFDQFTFDEQTHTYTGPYFNGDEAVEGYTVTASFLNAKLMTFELSDTEGGSEKVVCTDYGTTEVIPPSEYTDGNEGGDPAAPDLTVGGKIFIFFDVESDDASADDLEMARQQSQGTTMQFFADGTFAMTKPIIDLVYGGTYTQEGSQVTVIINTATVSGRPIEGAPLPMTVNCTLDGQTIVFTTEAMPDTFVTNIFVLKTN